MQGSWLRILVRFIAVAVAVTLLPKPCAGVYPESRDGLVIVTQWERVPSRWLLESYERELGNLMLDLGIRFQLSTLEEASSRSFTGPIVVLRMVEGRRHLQGRSPNVPASALAWTHISETEVTPFGAVDLAALRSFLRWCAGAGTAPNSMVREGAAIARVAAHELYHMLTRSTTHSDCGLMKPLLSRQELLDLRSPEWTEENRRIALEVLARRATQMAGGVSGEQSPEAGNR